MSPKNMLESVLDMARLYMLNSPYMSSITTLSPRQLRQAASLKEQIQSLEKQAAQILGLTAKSAAAPAPKKKYKMSAAGRARIAAAARARWAKVKGTKPAAKATPKTKSKMSAAARAKISAAAKARWAKAKAAGRKSL